MDDVHSRGWCEAGSRYVEPGNVTESALMFALIIMAMIISVNPMKGCDLLQLSISLKWNLRVLVLYFFLLL